MENPQMLAKEAGIISWHVLAALLGAFPYFYLGMFLSLFTRKPLTYGGGFLFFVEFVVMIIPSSLKLLSLSVLRPDLERLPAVAHDGWPLGAYNERCRSDRLLCGFVPPDLWGTHGNVVVVSLYSTRTRSS